MLSSNLTPEDWISGPAAQSPAAAPTQTSTPAPRGDALFDQLLWRESGGKQTDSKGNPITSKKGAIGIAQVMPGTAPEAAKLAGLEYDDMRYRTDAEYNKALGRAYFNKQLSDFGDPAKALAAYNAGPSAVSRAVQTANQAGNPEGWLNYLPAETRAYVPAIMSKSGMAQGQTESKPGDYYTPKDSNLVAYEPDNRTFFDRVAGGFRKGLEQSKALAGSAAALVDRTVTGEEGNDFQKSALAYADEHNRLAAKHGSNVGFSEAAFGDGSFSDWLADSVGYLAYQTTEALVTGGAGALLGKTVGKDVVLGVAKNRIASEAARIAASETGKSLTKEQIGQMAAKRVAAELTAGTTLFANNLRQEAGGIYQDALENQNQTGQDPNLAKIWLSSLAAAGVDTAADAAAAKGLFGRGSSSAKTVAGRAATQIPRQMGIQGSTEGTQSLIENYGAGEDPFTKKNLMQALDEAAVGALGGIVPGVGASINRVPAELRPAIDKAQEPNSPLSKAAVAGADGYVAQQADAQAQAQAEQQSQIQPDPSIRLNELRAKVDAGSNLTADELNEYDQLNDVASRNEQLRRGDALKSDPIFQRVNEIEQEIRDKGVLGTLRNIGQSGVTEKEFLEALAIARNPELDKKSPLIRQRALESLEMAMQWASDGKMPGIKLSDSTAVATQPQPKQPGTGLATQGSREVAGTAQPFFDPNTVDVNATRVDNMLPGPRAIEGPRTGIGMDAQTTQDAQPTASQPQALGFTPSTVEQSAQPAANIVSPSKELSVDEATNGLPRVQIPAATDQEKGVAATAQRRKRKAQIEQLVGLGFETVEVGQNGPVLVNSKTGQRVALDSWADAQMARFAIASAVSAKANTAKLDGIENPSDRRIERDRSEAIEINGVKVRIENQAGSTRKGVGPDGKPWETTMAHHYGEILRTEGADGDRVDVFIGNRPDSNKVFVVDQVNPDGTFDEHKLVFGATSEEDVRQTYLANYEPGWTGLGAIKEIPVSELKSWLKNGAKKPAAESEIGTFTVKSEGKTYTLNAVPVDSLPTAADSTPRGEPAKRITKQQALLLKALAGFFGKDVIFYTDPNNSIASDGFVKPGDDVTIYINERSGISPLAVFGHELMHLLKRDNPQAYAAIEKVVRDRVTDPAGFRADYNATTADKVDGGALDSSELEELISDLNGNLMRDQSFWKDVFDEIQASSGKESKSIIAQLAAYVQRIIDSAAKAFGGKNGFKADKFVKDMDAVRAAFRDAMAQYAKEQGLTKAAMQAAVLKEQQKAGDIKRSSAKTPDDGLTVEGYHFSQQPRSMLSTGFYGTGLKGSDREEIMGHQDRRLRERLSFYVNKGTGVRPESGVGGIAHKATLTNIYDADADVKRLKQGRSKRDFESAVLNSGYSGYLSRMDGSQPGQAILLGRQVIKPEVLGLRTQIDDAKKAPAPAQRKADLGDRVEAIKFPLNGELRTARWAQLIMAADPELAAQLMEIGALDGDKPLYKDGLVHLVRDKTSEIKRSAKRSSDEYAEVEAKYKDTDAWMKAPNGQATKLTERQWVHVRTPSFKSWFGDWESAAKAGGVWAAKPGTVSTVVDENGEPLVVYHGTDKGGFMEFDQPGGTKRGDYGIFATDNWDMARSYVRKGRASNVVDTETGEQTGWRYISNKTGEPLFTMGLGDDAETRAQREQAYDAKAEPVLGKISSTGDQPGIYSLFLNIRNPNESDFEGAYWSGERPGQYVVRDADGEIVYNEDGRAYFEERDQAEALAEQNGGEVESAPEHYETTDAVVRDAWKYKNDGAIIRNVVDDGGGPGGYYGTPADVFVALEPNQVKSADFNNGEYSPTDNDIRRSTDREYKLDIEREDRVKSKAVRLDPAEVSAIESDAKAMGLSPATVRDLIQAAKDSKRQYPAREGWAQLQVIGVESKKDDGGNPIPGSEQLKFQPIGYGFNVPPGKSRAPAKMDTGLMEKVADKFEKLILDVYDRAKAGDKNAQIIVGHQTWYRNVAEVLRREYGASGDMLADLLGATSPNTPVDTNWKFSIDIMRRFFRGDFDADLQKFDDYIKAGGDASKYPSASKIRQISGKLYGMNSTNAMKALLDMWRVIESGQAPKARNFALNLIGQSNMATIDVWAARMLRRAANMVRGMDLPRIPPPAEMGVSGVWNASKTDVTGEFGFGAAVMDRVSKALAKKGIEVTPPDLQAIAWFAEKELWGQKGWTTKTGEGGSFEENIDATPVERYLAGWSIQQGEKRPESGAASVAQARVMSMLIGDDTVVSARVMPTFGLYGGTVEASFDTEWTVQKGKHDPAMVMAEIAKLAKENNQYDIFVSRVVQPGENNPNARPGVEIFFKNKKSLEAAMPILERFTSRGQDGFTMAVDPRAKLKSLDDQEFIGVRLQYVPEISMRWDEGSREELLKPGAIEQSIEEKRQLLNDIAAEVRGMDGVAFASMQNYDTVVVGKENYDEYIDRVAEVGDRKVGRKAWFGQPVRQGLEGAAARYRGELRQVDAGRVSDAGSGVQAESAAGADARAILDAGGVRRSASRVDASGREDQGPGREKDGSLKGLPRDFTVAGIDIRASHWAPAEKVARQYMERAGLEYQPPTKYAKVDKQRAARIAAEYDRMKHDPKNPMVKAAYQALAKETIEQYRAVIDSGLKVEFIDFAKQGDPYAASPRLATEDVRNNNHMWVFSTRDGFGSDSSFDPEDNPLLAETEFEISGQKALVNDLFRVVHDYFGHVKEGVGFRADGEENTWRSHSAMFSPLAQRALTTETRGQNSWVNFGPYGEQNRTATADTTRFADQKTGLLPMWVSEDGRYDEEITPSKQHESDDNIVISVDDEQQQESTKDEVTADEARGRKVTIDVEVEETGETAKMKVDAGQAIKDYDDRIDTMKKLLECLSK